MRILAAVFVALVLFELAGALHADTRTIYQDSFNTPGTNRGGPYTSSLDGTAPSVASQDFDATSYAGQVWHCEYTETAWWGQTNQGTAPNTYVHASSSDWLAFTPKAGEVYTLTATIQSLSGVDWFTLGFAQTPGNWVGGNGHSLYNDPEKVMDLNQLARPGQPLTITLTLDTTAPGWTNSTGLAYVGWVTDSPGAQGANISNFSLTATKIGSYHNIRGTVTAGGSALAGATVYYSTTSGGPYSTVVTASDGTYSISEPANSGPYYIKAGKSPQYADSSERSVSVGNSDATGIDFNLSPAPTVNVSGAVSDDLGGVSGATVSYSLSQSGPFSTVTSASNGTYSFPAYLNQIYYVKASALGHTDSALSTVTVVTSPVTGVNFNLARTIVANGDFSANGAQYTTAPGYSASPNPTAPTAWAVNSIGAGVNGNSVTNVFGPDAKPSGFWCFMQNSGTYIKQTIATAAGKSYIATYSVAGRSGYAAGSIRGYISGDGGSTDLTGLTSVVSTSAFQQVNFAFTAPAATTLVFKNVSPSGGDYTVNVTNISVMSTLVIRGTVRSGGTALSGATIYYSTTSGGPYYSIVSLGDGTYIIPADASRTYFLKASKAPQYLGSSEISVPVGTSDVTGVDFNLAAAQPYTITASVVGTGGTISPAGTTTLYQGQDQSYDITPDSGKVVVSLKIDGMSVPPTTSYKFTNVTANHTITAAFGKPVGMGSKSVLTDQAAPGREIRTWGKVKDISNLPAYFVINDGYGDVTVMLNGLAAPSNLDTAKTATVTGYLASDRKVYLQSMSITPDIIDGNTELKKMHYGFFVHYVWHGDTYGVTIKPDGSQPSSFAEIANTFDANRFANELASWQVEYVIFTAWHANINPLFPSQTMLDWGLPNHHCQRDVLGDMIKAVRAKGIKVLFYTHPCDGWDLSANDQAVTGFTPFNYQKWNDFTCGLYGELVDRYGDDLIGIYLDGDDPSAFSGSHVDYNRLWQVIKGNHPNLIMIQNWYGHMYTCDIGDHEVVHNGPWGSTDGNTWPAYVWPSAICVGTTFWAATPAGTWTVPYSAESIFRYTVLNAGANTAGGGVQWASGPYCGNGWETGVNETMTQVGAYIKAIAPSIKNVYASAAYPTPEGATINSVAWGVATDSADGSATFLHVLKPQAGRTLTIGKAANGVVFMGASMLISGKPLGFTSNVSGYVLTLPEDEMWDKLDTVIRLQVSGK